MPANEDLEGQLKIQQDINKVLAKRAKMFDAQADYLTGQVRLAKELCKALDCKELEGMEERLAGIQAGFKGAAEEAEGLESATHEAGKAAEESEASFDKMAIAAGAAVGAMNGFRGAIGTIESLGQAAMRVVGTIFNIGKAILSIPFKILNGLVGMASKAGGGAPVLRQAWEDVRETFGSLEKATGGALYNGFKKMRKEAKNLGGTGVSLRRIYGRGKEGLAKAAKDTAEQFGHLEASAHRYAAEIEGSMGTLAAWGKTLYGTAEDMKALDHRSRVSGKSMSDTMTEFGNQTSQMRDKYHLDAKLFSRDMMAMSADVEHFGGMGSAELAALTVYTHELGIEAKSLTSVIDKWDNFESAAEGASKLAQTFGMNVDAMEMMNEQNPAKRMDMLRNSFLESGKAVEDLTRAEKKLLAEQMGLADVADLEKAMADPTMNYDDILAEAEANEEASLTQEEALQSLADTIKREFGGGAGKQFSSFGDALMQGFMKGMSRDKEFREMLRAVRCALYQVYHIGKALGKAFADLPLVEGLFKNITGFFKSFDFAGFKDALVGKDGKGGLFRALYDGLIDPDANPAEVVETFMDKLQKAFEDAGSESGTSLQAVKESFIAIGKVIGKFFLGMLPYAMDGLAELINKLSTALEYMFSTDAEKDANAAFKSFGDGLDPGIKKAFESIQKSWEDNLEPAIGRLFAIVKPHLETLANWMLIYIIGKSVLGALFGGIATFMGTVGIKSLSNAILGKKAATETTARVATKSSEMFAKIGTKLADGAKGIGTKLGKAGKMAFKPSTIIIEKSLQVMSKTLEKTGVKAFGSASSKLMKEGFAEGMERAAKPAGELAEKSIGKFGAKAMKGAGKMGAKLAKLGVKAIPIVGWGIAIADGALGMSRQMDLLEGKLGEKFDDAAATAGAGAAGVVEFLTLGLLPQPALDAIGNFTATAVEAMGGLFDMLGLKGVYDMLVANMNLVFKVFAGVGDILVGLFTGDGDKVTKGFGQIFEGMWEFVKTIPGALVSLLIELPWTILKFLLTAVKFIFISLPLKIIGAVSTLLANVAFAVYNFFTGFWKKGDKNTGTKIKEFFKGMWKSVKDGFFAGVEAVYTFFSEMWTDIKDEVKAAFGISSPSSFFADIGTALIDGLWSILTFLPQKFWQLATWAWEKFTGIFDGVGTWAHNFLASMFMTLSNLPANLWALAKKAWCKLTSVFDAAKTLGSDIVSGILKGIGDLGKLLWDLAKKAWKKMTSVFSNSPVDDKNAAGGLLGQGIKDGVVKGLDGLGDAVKQPFLDAWESVKTIFSPAAIAQLFMGIASVVASAGEMLLNAILMPYKTALEMLTQFFGPMLNKLFVGVVGAIMNIGEMVFNALTMPYKMALKFVTTVLNFSTFAKLGNQMIQGLLSTIGMLPEKIWEIGKAALGVLIKVFGFGPLRMIGSFLVSGLMSGVSTLPDQMVNVFWNMMDTVKGMFDNVLETFGITGAVERIMDAFVQPHDVLETLTREYEFLNYGLEKLTAQVDDIARIITEDTVDRVLHTVDMISEIVDNYNEINNLLSDIDPINLDANINKLGKNMSLSSETITIKNKPINITVNLHASMDAKGIATQLSKKGNAVQLAVASRNGTSVTNNVG